LELLLAAHGQCPTPAEWQYVNHRVFLGRFFEVTREGEVVWEYVNPFFGKPFFGGSPNPESNQVFRAVCYGADEIARARSTG
jgi:hypothetical protein